MRKSINPMFGLKIRGEAGSGSAPSLIVLMSLRRLFLGELHSCIARLRFAGRSIFRPRPVICQLLFTIVENHAWTWTAQPRQTINISGGPNQMIEVGHAG
jgi:hypothetical protein